MKSFGKGDRVPQLPRKAPEQNRMTDAMLDAINKRNPIMPEAPMGEGRDIVAPNLMRQTYFMSEHGGTPDQSDEEEEFVKPVTTKKVTRPQTAKPSATASVAAPKASTQATPAMKTTKGREIEIKTSPAQESK
jgi:hypothetical protein